MASPRNRHCANCIGTLSFPIWESRCCSGDLVVGRSSSILDACAEADASTLPANQTWVRNDRHTMADGRLKANFHVRQVAATTRNWTSGGSALGPGGVGGHRPLKSWLGFPNLAALSTHCGHLILRKICTFDATRCQILRLKCTKFDFRWGSAPDPAERTYSDPADPLSVLKGHTFK